MDFSVVLFLLLVLVVVITVTVVLMNHNVNGLIAVIRSPGKSLECVQFVQSLADRFICNSFPCFLLPSYSLSFLEARDTSGRS